MLMMLLGWPYVAAQSPSGIVPSKARLEHDVTVLTGIVPHRNYLNPTSMDSAARFIENTFRQLDCDVSRQSFSVQGHDYHNIMAEFGPPGAPRIVVGAHYDVCGDQPGADDNASGVAGLLELATLLNEHKPGLSHRVELVAYALEEPPFFRTESMGSFMHAQRLADSNADVALMMSVEMIGFFSDESESQSYPIFFLDWFYPATGNFIAVVGKFGQGRTVGRVRDFMEMAGSLPVSSISAPGFIKGVDFSDHLNYWKFGYQAVMITDTAFMRNPHYHEPTDTKETLDYNRMAGVVLGLYHVVVNW